MSQRTRVLIVYVDCAKSADETETTRKAAIRRQTAAGYRFVRETVQDGRIELRFVSASRVVGSPGRSIRGARTPAVPKRQ